MNKDITFSKLRQESKHGQHFQIAPLSGIRTGTTRLRQVGILLGRNPIQDGLLNSPTANSPKAVLPFTLLRNSATIKSNEERSRYAMLPPACTSRTEAGEELMAFGLMAS